MSLTPDATEILSRARADLRIGLPIVLRDGARHLLCLAIETLSPDRLAALEMAGIATADLPFDADFGRKLEYYDGVVFEVAAAGRPDLPLAGGGRYDSMTARLGAVPPVPAVGGMVRPEAALAAGERA